MSARAFLDQLYGGCTGGYVEARALGPGGPQRLAVPVGDWRALGTFVTDAVRAQRDVYVGVATRRTPTRGSASHLLELPALHADLDRVDAVARLATFPFRPSIVVRSGTDGHLQAYWQLREPEDARADGPRLAALLRRLARHLDADLHATDLARILRLPNTYNFKGATPQPVQLVECRADVAVNLGELDAFLPQEVVYRGERRSECCLTEGLRNAGLFGLARSLRFRGVPSRTLARALEWFNEEWCRPPLDRGELQRIYTSALHLRDDPAFVARQQGVVPDAEVHAEEAATC